MGSATSFQRYVVAGLVLSLLATAHAAVSTPRVLARDVAAESGLDFVNAGYHAGDRRGSMAFYEATGGGACWGDVDGDGALDVFLPDYFGRGGEGAGRLYRNAGATQDGGWSFVDVTERFGITAVGVGQGCVFGDYDNDGWQDLYVTFARTPFAPQHNQLYHNEGGRAFTDVTERAGVTGDATPGATTPPCEPAMEIAGASVGRCWSVAAAWLDHDLDGDLDLYVTNYARFPFGSCIAEFAGNPVHCFGQANRLYRNNGDGTFTDVGATLGVAFNGQQTLGRSLGVVAADVDGDGWTDLYVANDKDANALYLNDRGERFTDVAAARGADNFGPLADGSQENRAGMGVDAGDFDGDGRVDLVSTHLRAEFDALYRNLGDRFEDVAVARGYGETVALDVSRWGVGFVDFDLDGRKDILVVAGGQIRTEPGPLHLLLARAGGFVAQPHEVWPFVEADRRNHRGAAFADFDNDGDMDVLVPTLPSWQDPAPARPRLVRFDTVGTGDESHGNRFLRVELTGTDSARDAVGASVQVTTDDGRSQWQQRTSGGSYASGHDPRLVFGFGNATTGTVTVTWPGGVVGPTVPFDVGAKRGMTVRVTEPDTRAPAPVTWAPDAVTEEADGKVTVAWRSTFTTDFAGYRIYQGRTADFAAADATVHTVDDREVTRFTVPDARAGAYFRVAVVDSGGQVSELSAVASLAQEAARTTPAPGATALLMVGLAFILLRRR